MLASIEVSFRSESEVDAVLLNGALLSSYSFHICELDEKYILAVAISK
jgi:hypothetical protein